jgi:hypothetical protein
MIFGVFDMVGGGSLVRIGDTEQESAGTPVRRTRRRNPRIVACFAQRCAHPAIPGGMVGPGTPPVACSTCYRRRQRAVASG